MDANTKEFIVKLIGAATTAVNAEMAECTLSDVGNWIAMSHTKDLVAHAILECIDIDSAGSYENAIDFINAVNTDIPPINF